MRVSNELQTAKATESETLEGLAAKARAELLEVSREEAKDPERLSMQNVTSYTHSKFLDVRR